jgi:hypothetical protein
MISIRQAIAERALLKEKKIKTIEVHSFEGSGDASKGFFCEKKISNNYRKIEIYTKAFVSGRSLLTSYYNDLGQLVETSDSSETNLTRIIYFYNINGYLNYIISESRSNDDDFITTLTEEHRYTLNNKGTPLNMLCIKNKKDTISVTFTLDEKGNVTDEIEKSPIGRHYYYYYDDKNRLTDIVKYNVIKAQLLPDFVFEYNREGQLTQMVSVEEGVNSDYYTWKYVYDEGLRIIEKCFSKEKLLLGYFEYEYK